MILNFEIKRYVQTSELHRAILSYSFILPSLTKWPNDKRFFSFVDYWYTTRRAVPTGRNGGISRAFTQTVMWSVINLNRCCFNKTWIWLLNLSTTGPITMACIKDAITHEIRSQRCVFMLIVWKYFVHYSLFNQVNI